MKRCYPYSIGRSSHSLFPPSRNSPLESRLLISEASSHGLFHNNEQVQCCDCSPEFQRTQGLACLSRELLPSMGFMSWDFYINRLGC
jgi:hypothetical protein